tara:strand:- start:1754 stop:2446 length:693 start_codon:yes stop_codon:yes gene_type:complete
MDASTSPSLLQRLMKRAGSAGTYLFEENMSKKLLREFYALCKDGVCQDLLTEREKAEMSNGAMYLSGRLQTADKQNGNGRVYPYEVLKREMDNYNKVVSDNRACGELDHPDDSVVNLKNVSHIITKVWWEGKDVMGKIKVLDTPSGRILKDLVNAGVKLGISSRGLGSVKESAGQTVVESDFQLICFDMVSEPSTPNAYVYPKDQGNISTRLREVKENSINDLFKKILGD